MPSEFSLIDAFRAHFDLSGHGVSLGSGDDCAVLAPSPGMEICATVDAAVEGVHFSSRTFEDWEIGHKALAMNLSDLAAMGAAPRWFLCSVAAPPDEENLFQRLSNIACGMGKLARKSGAVLIGGNFTHADVLSIHITAMGEVPAGQAMCRTGARPGDVLCVTGCLGGAALGLKALTRDGLRVSRQLRSRQCTPEPRLSLGQLLRPMASSAIDISDGLLQDLGHVCRASQAGLELDISALPTDSLFDTSEAAQLLCGGDSAAQRTRLVLTGGEDYELALTIPEEKFQEASNAAARAGIPLTAIGRVTEGSGVHLIGAPPMFDILPHACGFDHFLKP